jgi:hypothetical protein
MLGLSRSSADAALILRLILASCYVGSLVFFSYYTTRRQGGLLARRDVLQRRAFIIISTLQFHPLFWAGRTTPNGIVIPLFTVALALIFSTKQGAFKRDYPIGLSILTACQVIARMEIIGIVIPIALCGLFSPKLGSSYMRRFKSIAVTGLSSAIASICESGPFLIRFLTAC